MSWRNYSRNKQSTIFDINSWQDKTGSISKISNGDCFIGYDIHKPFSNYLIGFLSNMWEVTSGHYCNLCFIVQITTGNVWIVYATELFTQHYWYFINQL